MNAVVNQAEQAQLAEAAPPQVPRGGLSVVQYAVQSGAPIEQVQALLELQVRADNHQLELMREKRRMDKEDRETAAKRAFDEALAKFRGYNVIIPKTKQVKQVARSGGPGPTFMQSEFDVVCRLLSPALSECGFSFRHDQRFGSKKWTTDGKESDIPWVYVTCILTHREGHTETLDLEGPPDTSGAKNPLQEMQSAASFLKRQGLLAITGTATGGEDDENKLGRRGQQTEGDGDADNAAAAAFLALVDAGNAEAAKGLKPLTAWWGTLNSRQQKDLSAEFGAMRKVARQADERGAK